MSLWLAAFGLRLGGPDGLDQLTNGLLVGSLGPGSLLLQAALAVTVDLASARGVGIRPVDPMFVPSSPPFSRCQSLESDWLNSSPTRPYINFYYFILTELSNLTNPGD